MNGTVNQLVLVSSGNKAMVAAGTPLIQALPGGGIQRNLLGGQLFAANRHTLVAIDHTSISATNHNDLIFGVGIDKDGDGYAESWRSINLSGFGVASLEAEPPRCGLPSIKDFLFKCTEAEESYSLDIEIQNNFTRSYMPMHRGDRFTVTIDTDGGGCENCTSSHNCKEIACKIQDFFTKKILDRYPNWMAGKREFPFYARRLFPNDYVFCFTPSNGDCKDCTHVNALDSFSFNGGEPISFTAVTNPDDNTQTLLPQLTHVMNQINAELGANGSAVLVRGTGGCCAYQLRVNTCYDDFVLFENVDEEDTEIVPCETSNPLEPIEVGDDCPSCPAGEESTITFDCGVRFIMKPELLDCNCQFPTLPPKAYFSGDFEIFPTDGWANNQTRVRSIQRAQLPENFGYWIKWLEYSQTARNLGKNVTSYNQNTGYANLPRNDSRIANAVSYADCKKDYCTYDLTHRKSWSKGSNAGIDADFHSVLEHVKIAVPNGDSDTKTSVQSFWTAWVALINARGYNQLATVTCASDQDQSGNYVEPNGSLTE